MNAEQYAWIIRAMSEPSFYDHPVSEVEMIETHISLVFLAGDFAYKVKKPLNLGFLDFSTLEKRQHFCQLELQFNRNFTSQLYLDLIQIGGSPEAPVINAYPAIEYAVKMHRFPQECQLDRLLTSGKLQPSHMVAFAEQIAVLHRAAQHAEADTPYGSPEAAIKPIEENFRQIRPCVQGTMREGQLSRLEAWSRASYDSLRPVISQRKADGFVRACHGDLHLANMAWVDAQPVLFDCIEFSENLRWIDVINDIAFLVMDLDDREHAALGWIFLNRYLQATGDYQGLSLINIYKAYRAMVRAKVTCLRLAQGHLSEEARAEVEHLFQSYLDLAEQYSHAHSVPLIITHGLSGAGKSTFASQLASAYGAIHLRSDIERKRLYGLDAKTRSGSPIDGGIYSAEAFADTYQRLLDLAETVLRAGMPVIVDATFLKGNQRELFYSLAEQLQSPLLLLDFVVPQRELRRRIERRSQGESIDPSEASIEVLDYQIEHAEPLTPGEEPRAVSILPGMTVEDVIPRLPQPTASNS